MPKTELNTRNYWEERLANQTNLKGTGHRAFNMENNLWLYRAQRECLDQILDKNEVPVSGKSVLDIGSGTGFFIDYYLQRQVGSIVGVDITDSSIRYLKDNYPSGTYFNADISEKSLPFQGSFDIVSAMGVLYHIVNDECFSQAIKNICAFISPGGYLLISDSFKTPFLPTAKHAHMRPLEEYQLLFAENGVSIVEIMPVYFMANRTYIPIIGPAIINGLNLGQFLYNLDNNLRAKKRSNGAGLKTLLAHKIS
jgi:SAM-dependent methyltransferase